MIHLKPADGTSRFLCCFQSSLMLAPGDAVTDDPNNVTCAVDIEYEAFEKMLIAPINWHERLAVKVKELIWEMLVDRRINNAFAVPPEKRRAFLEEFGTRLRKIDEEQEGQDLLLAIRKEQVKELKRIAKAFREHAAQLSQVLIRVMQANPPYPIDEIPKSCGACGTPAASCDTDCSAAAEMAQHNFLIREIEKLLTTNPLA